MILGLNICMYCSKTNGQSESSKIVQVSLVTLWCQQKQSMTEGWTERQTMDEMILILVTHDNNNDNTFDPDRYYLTKS